MSIIDLVQLALAEDSAHGDVTTLACIDSEQVGSGTVRAKQRLILCGHVEAQEVFRQVGASYEVLVDEGSEVEPQTPVAHVQGRVADLLVGERPALNFLMRLSGVATHTHDVVQVASGIRLVDTRKTTPGLRISEKRAVRMGGAHNHRFGLSDGILIKDNHVHAAGGITAAVERAQSTAHHLLKIEVEVGDLDGVREAIEAGADIALLDNMSDAQMAAAVRLADGRVRLEASGNLDAQRLQRLAGIGVDYASMGGLIHQARWADLSMKLDREG